MNNSSKRGISAFVIIFIFLIIIGAALGGYFVYKNVISESQSTASDSASSISETPTVSGNASSIR